MELPNKRMKKSGESRHAFLNTYYSIIVSTPFTNRTLNSNPSCSLVNFVKFQSPPSAQRMLTVTTTLPTFQQTRERFNTIDKIARWKLQRSTQRSRSRSFLNKSFGGRASSSELCYSSSASSAPSASSGCAIVQRYFSSSVSSIQHSKLEEHRTVASHGISPDRVFSWKIISLGNFAACPSETFQACPCPETWILGTFGWTPKVKSKG